MRELPNSDGLGHLIGGTTPSGQHTLPPTALPALHALHAQVPVMAVQQGSGPGWLWVAQTSSHQTLAAAGPRLP